LNLGNLEFHVFNTGYVWLDGGAMFGVIPKPMWEKKIPSDERNRIRLAMNALLIHAGGKRILVETGAGDITVFIAADVAVNVRASVDMGSGHHITSEFPDIHVSSEGNQWEKTLTAEGKLNGGGPTVKVHTSSGDICIRRAK